MQPPEINKVPGSKWAILIGIEYYPPGGPEIPLRKNDRGEILKFEPLQGCVNDVLDMEKYLSTTMGVPSGNIIKLLSPRPDYRRARDLGRYELATYENILYVLKNVGRWPGSTHPEQERLAQKDDFVYIHFSGHGMVTTTLFSRFKEPHIEYDEALVPCDIAQGGQFLRDLELAAILEDQVEKGLLITIVLDCCHSGGALRGPGDDENATGLTRGSKDIYVSTDEQDRCQEMARVAYWAQSKPSWIGEPEGYVALTACQKDELAKEGPLPPYNGLLTYHLLKCLRESPVDVPSQTLFERVRSAVQQANTRQRPDLIGDNERFFFSKETRRHTYALRVIHTSIASADYSRSMVVLDGGAMHGIQQDYGYEILRQDFDFSHEPRLSDVLAKVKVTKVSEGHSEAMFRRVSGLPVRWAEIKNGCPAVLDRLPLERKMTVRFLALDETSDTWFRHSWEDEGGDDMLLRLVDAKDATAFCTVRIDESANFTIQEPSGLFPPVMEKRIRKLPASDTEDGVLRLIRRLEHIARYRIIRGLGSSTPTVDFAASRLVCEVKTLSPGSGSLYQDGKEYRPASEVRFADGIWAVPEDSLVRLSLRNISSAKFYVEVFCCAPELTVGRIYPTKNTLGEVDVGEKSAVEVVIAPGVPTVFRDAPLIDSPQSARRAGVTVTELYKVFVTTERMVSLSSLVLRSLEEAEKLGNHRGAGSGGNELDEVLGILDGSRSPKVFSKEEVTWGLVDVKIGVIPKPVEHVEVPEEGLGRRRRRLG